MTSTGRPATAPDRPTGRIVSWVADLQLTDVPPRVRDRAAHLLLDGVGCLLVGSHLPWSEVGVAALTRIDGSGDALIAGWGGRTTSAATATLLNGSLIQGFELDDYADRQAAIRTTVLGMADHDNASRDLLDLLTADVRNALA